MPTTGDGQNTDKISSVANAAEARRHLASVDIEPLSDHLQLIDIIFNDLRPATKQLFQGPWYDGIIVQIVKFAVARTRPELWLGPFQHARSSASSFPSGHTVGAFALAGVLMFSSDSKTMRVVAGLLALAVAVSRVLAFRHWTSDVLASAAIGMILAAIAIRAVMIAEV